MTWFDTGGNDPPFEPAPAGAHWCFHCKEWFLPILGVRNCPFCERRGQRIPGSSTGRTPRFGRGNRGSSPRPGMASHEGDAA